ncbi:phage tail termination protein [Scandinavium manionii]|uniref:phage tail termination protein n=1 Tax=Scandinavium manionii TaxID=2926520 RepID=UPI002166587A|nr:hypothetical protein [Scandinavium manionii]MCS2167545.1 hypothetical protein [Scandinavium manionii]
MTPMMHERVRDLFVEERLTGSAKVQVRYWKDSGIKTDAFVVFRQAGGTAIRNDLSSEYRVQVDVIGVKNKDDDAENMANAMLSYVQDTPMPSDCIGHIENVGGFPHPMLSTEGRIVYSLLFACLYGE